MLSHSSVSVVLSPSCHFLIFFLFDQISFTECQLLYIILYIILLPYKWILAFLSIILLEIFCFFCKILPVHSYADIFNQYIQQFYSKSLQLSAFTLYLSWKYTFFFSYNTNSVYCHTYCDKLASNVVIRQVLQSWLLGLFVVCRIQLQLEI